MAIQIKDNQINTILTQRESRESISTFLHTWGANVEHNYTISFYICTFYPCSSHVLNQGFFTSIEIALIIAPINPGVSLDHNNSSPLIENKVLTVGYKSIST